MHAPSTNTLPLATCRFATDHGTPARALTKAATVWPGASTVHADIAASIARGAAALGGAIWCAGRAHRAPSGRGITASAQFSVGARGPASAERRNEEYA